MFRVLRLLVLLYLLIILQTTLAPAIEIGGIRPDFAFLLVLLVALHEGSAGGAIAGFAAGLFIDLNSAQSLGVTSLVNSLVAFGVGSMADRLVRDSLATRVIVSLAATVVRDQLVVFLLLPGGFVASLKLFVLGSLPGGLYTAVFAPPIMAITDRVAAWDREAARGLR